MHKTVLNIVAWAFLIAGAAAAIVGVPMISVPLILFYLFVQRLNHKESLPLKGG